MEFAFYVIDFVGLLLCFVFSVLVVLVLYVVCFCLFAGFDLSCRLVCWFGV